MKTKQHWYQLHWSICIVLLFLAGVFIAANVTERFDRVEQVKKLWSNEYMSVYIRVFGWPFPFKDSKQTGDPEPPWGYYEDQIPYQMYRPVFSWLKLLLNILIGVAGLALVGTIFEHERRVLDRYRNSKEESKK